MAVATCLVPTGILQITAFSTTKYVLLSPCAGFFGIHWFKQLLQMGFVVFVVFFCPKCQGNNATFCSVHLTTTVVDVAKSAHGYSIASDFAVKGWEGGVSFSCVQTPIPNVKILMNYRSAQLIAKHCDHFLCM